MATKFRSKLIQSKSGIFNAVGVGVSQPDDGLMISGVNFWLDDGQSYFQYRPLVSGSPVMVSGDIISDPYPASNPSGFITGLSASELLDVDVDNPVSGQSLIYDGSVWNNQYVNPIEMGVACSDETTALTTGTAKVTFRAPCAITLTEVRASVTTAPVGSAIIVDVNEGGASILSTKISIDASEKTSTTADAAPVISGSGIADDAEITVDIDQVGSTTAGAGLKVWLIGNRA